ncbi:hypothetical protein NP233_g2781 [Leucocoprinus birnbaumii]|uniref:Uncharacterized protein n=1 Tax=Leucocoprinus birnbaumii TaxID=56174 RepID=A0AAD5YUJ3_9AGAR|nr:hypothetical protein NP233_g2781 [Leucocoprinus birnbaumii]
MSTISGRTYAIIPKTQNPDGHPVGCDTNAPDFLKPIVSNGEIQNFQVSQEGDVYRLTVANLEVGSSGGDVVAGPVSFPVRWYIVPANGTIDNGYGIFANDGSGGWTVDSTQEGNPVRLTTNPITFDFIPVLEQ